jgi:hypothetical protein
MIEHKQAYNINIVNIGEIIIWKWKNTPFAFRYDNMIYLTNRHLDKPMVGEYLSGIKRMKSDWMHLHEEGFDAKYKECGLDRKNKIIGVLADKNM